MAHQPRHQLAKQPIQFASVQGQAQGHIYYCSARVLGKVDESLMRDAGRTNKIPPQLLLPSRKSHHACDCFR